MLKTGIVGLVIISLAVKYFKYKIGNLAILLYLAENNIKLPNDKSNSPLQVIKASFLDALHQQEQ